MGPTGPIKRAFFESQDRQLALTFAASKWVGTPFRHNSCVLGVGVNCVLAIVAVLEDVGFAVPNFELKPASWSRYQTNSVMEQFLDGHPELFKAVDKVDGVDLMDTLLVGDVIGFKVGLCIHHLGIVLPGRTFFQCNEAMGCVVLSMAEREFVKRFDRAWRPLTI